MTSMHLDMLNYLSHLSGLIEKDPTNKLDICLVHTGSPSIDYFLLDVGNRVDFFIIENKINQEFIPDKYKKALIFAFKELSNNNYFEGRKVFDTFNT